MGRLLEKRNIYVILSAIHTIYRGLLQKYHDEARHGKAFAGLLKRYFA
ncbi:MAG: hypothetical protein Q4P22_01900 [Eubacteriales bacterium]|nr:hypothetical protein [Eubacteriales bacterium]